MILQFDIEGFEWILGIALMFGFALIFTYITYKDLNSFIIWLTIFCGFVVWGGLLPLWVLILCIIVLIIVIYLQINNKNGNG